MRLPNLGTTTPGRWVPDASSFRIFRLWRIIYSRSSGIQLPKSVFLFQICSHVFANYTYYFDGIWRHTCGFLLLLWFRVCVLFVTTKTRWEVFCYRFMLGCDVETALVISMGSHCKIHHDKMTGRRNGMAVHAGPIILSGPYAWPYLTWTLTILSCFRFFFWWKTAILCIKTAPNLGLFIGLIRPVL